MNKTIKNILQGAGSVLNISGREPIHPDAFYTPSHYYPREIRKALFNDIERINSDMRTAWSRVTSIYDEKRKPN